MRSPRKCRISKICRRAALSSAVKTVSISARRRSALEADFERLDKRKLHRRATATRFAELAHGLPDGHHLGKLVRALRAVLVLPVQQLDEDRLLLAFRAAVTGRRSVGGEPDSPQRRPM